MLASLNHVRTSLESVFGAERVHFTTRRDNATFPCAVYTQDGEQLLAMISNQHHVVSIDVTVEVQANTSKEAIDKAKEVRQQLETGRHAVRRTSFDVDEYETETPLSGAPRLFIAASTYNVSE